MTPKRNGRGAGARRIVLGCNTRSLVSLKAGKGETETVSDDNVFIKVALNGLLFKSGIFERMVFFGSLIRFPFL